MRSDAVNHWVTIETLAADVMSVASVGLEPRDFASWQRVLQRQLAKSPALYSDLSTARLADIVRQARSHAEDVDLRVPTGSGPHDLKLRQVFGPAGDVHAVRLWLGPAESWVPTPAPAVGAIWDLESQTVQLPSGITRLWGVCPEEYVPATSIAELFHRVTGFDRHAEVLDLLYEPKPGARLQFDVAVTDGPGRTGQWRITIRARDDARTRGAWLLFEDVTSANSPEVWPTLERVGLREAHRRAGTHLAVVQLERTSISHWLTDPAPWIRWDYLFRPTDVFHPEDRETLIALGEKLRAGDTTGVTVRALNYAGGYTPTSMLLYPYPGYSSRQLAIAQLVRTGEQTPLLDAYRGAPDQPRSRGPIGYDDQLRHRVGGRMKPSPAC